MKQLLILLLSITFAQAKSGIDIAQVIAPSFTKGAVVTKKQFKLSNKEMKKIQKVSKAKLESNIVRMYTITKKSHVEGYAVLIVKTVRTKKAAVLYMIDTKNNIMSIEILAFNEPSEYKPNKAWQSVFKGKKKEDNLFSGKGIPTISGATLSARAIADASRIALSIVERYK